MPRHTATPATALRRSHLGSTPGNYADLRVVQSARTVLVPHAMLLGAIVALCTAAGTPARSVHTEPRRPDRLTPRPSATRAIAAVIGRVIDPVGRAIPNATIIATPAAPRGRLYAPRALSDRMGYFRFDGLPPGDYIFVALHGEHSPGVSPAMPVTRTLEVVLVVGDTEISV